MEQLESAIDQLVLDGILSEKQAFGLFQKGWEANSKFNSDVGADKQDQACNQMDAFLNQLDAFSPKFIPEAEYNELKDLAIAIMNEEGCFSPTP